MTHKGRLKHWIVALGLAALLAASAGKETKAETLSDAEVYSIAKDAYVFAYPMLLTDATLRKLSNFAEAVDGDVLRFAKGKLPPVDGFWSVTAYDIEGYFIPNSINRLAIGDRDKLAPNADGSVDLYIQANSPGKKKEANWLPVGKGPFTLLLRLYSPRENVLEGAWSPPPVVRQ
jgi:hypothetical protein